MSRTNHAAIATTVIRTIALALMPIIIGTLLEIVWVGLPRGIGNLLKR